MQHFDWFFTDDLLEDRLVDEVTYHIFLLLFISNNSLYVAMPLFIKWIKKTRQNVERASVKHLAAPRVPLFYSYKIFTNL